MLELLDIIFFVILRFNKDLYSIIFLFFKMEIVLEGIIPNEIVKEAKEGKIHPYVVCGVDVYRTPEIAAEDKVELDKSKPCKWNIDMFFSGRHYRVLHLLDSDEYDPQSTIADLRSRIMELKAKGTNFLLEDVLEQDDWDTAYVLTPLYDSELSELLKQ